MNFLAKVRELVEASIADPQLREQIDADAAALMEQFHDWPCATQVPLSRVATIIAALLLEPDLNVRRIRATDTVALGDGIG